MAMDEADRYTAMDEADRYTAMDEAVRGMDEAVRGMDEAVRYLAAWTYGTWQRGRTVPGSVRGRCHEAVYG